MFPPNFVEHRHYQTYFYDALFLLPHPQSGIVKQGKLTHYPGSRGDSSLLLSPLSPPLVSHVIWSLVVGLLPHSSSLMCLVPPAFECPLKPVVSVMVLSCKSVDAALLWSPL